MGLPMWLSAVVSQAPVHRILLCQVHPTVKTRDHVGWRRRLAHGCGRVGPLDFSRPAVVAPQPDGKQNHAEDQQEFHEILDSGAMQHHFKHKSRTDVGQQQKAGPRIQHTGGSSAPPAQSPPPCKKHREDQPGQH